MLSYSFHIVPLALSISGMFLWHAFKDWFALVFALGFLAVFISTLVSFFVSPGVIEYGDFVPSENYELYTRTAAILGTGGSTVGSIALLIFGLRAKKYS